MLHRLFFLLGMLASTGLFAQSLPSEMQITPDGRRLVSGGNAAQGLYDEDSVRTLSLYFNQPNYWTLLQNNYTSGADIPAVLVVNGEIYDSVGVHFKGQTSYLRNNSEKKSFNLTLDYVDPNQTLMGYETLNLNCGYDDPSSLREVLYNHLGRNYTPGLKANFVNLEINGQNWGPYANVQQLNGDYLKEWFMSNDGTRWRALKPGGITGPGGPGTGGPFGTGFSTLNYLGADTSMYTPYYTLKKTSKTHPWEDLVQVCDKLNRLPINQLEDSLTYYLDVDKTLWFLAHEIIFTDEDSYVWKGGMDYYLYWEPETGRMIPLEYDGNSCFVFNSVNWSPFYRETDARFPLMNRLFAVPGLRQRYLAHFRTILEEYLVPTAVDATIDAYVGLLDSLVLNDPKKIYSHSDFQSEVANIKSFVRNRRNFLLNNPVVSAQRLSISNVTYASQGAGFTPPDQGQAVEVSASISGTPGVDKVWLYYGTGFVGNFEKTAMWDDGLHGDGNAGDGVYGAEIPGFNAGTYVRYYVEAIANNTPRTTTYEPQGAEHDVFLYKVNARIAANSDVVINELMADNVATVADSAGDFDDWIELYNKGTQAVDLSGWFLTDKSDNLTKWEIPSGTSLGPNAYLIIWADENGSQGPLHANFKLSALGEELILLTPDSQIVDQVTFGAQTADLAYARNPNGTGNFVIQAPTFSQNNNRVTALEDPLQKNSNLVVFPNPATTEVFVQIEEEALQGELLVFNTLGQPVFRSPAKKTLTLDVSSWPSGMYVIRYQDQYKQLVVRY